MSYIGSKPASKPVVASDLDPAVITGQTALAVAPADTDEFLISDAGVLKRLDASLIGGGKIGQVLSTKKTDVFTTSSSSYADVTGLSVAITPSATSSKILCFCTGVYGKNTSDNFNHQVVRDSTSLIENKIDDGTGTNNTDVFSIQVLDSPSSTSELTYKLQIKNDGSNPVVINRNGAGTTDRGDSVITVMEVLA